MAKHRVGELVAKPATLTATVVVFQNTGATVFSVEGRQVARTIPIELELAGDEFLQRVDFHLDGQLIASVPFAIGVGHWLYVPPVGEDPDDTEDSYDSDP